MLRITTAFTLLALAMLIAGNATAGDGAGYTLTEIPGQIGIGDMTADGSVLAGSYQSGGHFIWTRENGFTNRAGVGIGTGISDDGSVLTGNTLDENGDRTAGIWLDGANWMSLGGIPGGLPLDGVLSSMFSVSGDGSTVVGLAWNDMGKGHAFRWDATNGIVDLGSTVEGRSSRANKVNDDGSMIIGWQEDSTGFRQACYWLDGVQTVLQNGALPLGEPFDVSSDGSLICGGGAGDFTNEAWIWNEQDGLRALGNLPEGSVFTRTVATDMSDDGSVVCGWSGDTFDRQAVYWTEETGLVYLRDHLLSLGVTEVEEIYITGVAEVSEDGNTIVAFGVDQSFQSRTFVIDFPSDDLTVSFDALTPTLALPGIAELEIRVSNPTSEDMQLAGTIEVTLCNGATRTIRTAERFLPAGAERTLSWSLRIPNNPKTCDCDLEFTVVVDDMTGDASATASCVVSTTCNL